MLGSQRVTRPDGYEQQQQQSPSQFQQTRQQQQQQASTFGEDGQETTTTSQAAEQVPLEQMSEKDRFGLSGLLRMIHSESPDVTSLTIGQDLMSLGLDLNQPESVESNLFF
jgi:CCR4-NOT transcription complex subunit 2